MTYSDVATYLDSFINYEKRPPQDYMRAFKLERMRRLLELLGDPQKGLKVIHVAGTKGKGSTSALIASILKESGLRTGLYTSPHLESFSERICVNGEAIPDKSFGRIVEGASPYFDSLKESGVSFFEVCTACAFLYFRECMVDLAVFEVGLGGRLDATNTAESIISVITPISLEHTGILGSTVSEIAREKAGIIRECSVCVSAAQEKEAQEEIEKVCAMKGSRLIMLGRDIHIEKGGHDEYEQYFNVRTGAREYKMLSLRLRGDHQIANAATAIGAAEALTPYGFCIREESIRSGMYKAEWPGRMELVHKSPYLILDGAQNEASSRALILAIKKHFTYKRMILVLGISSDKDIEGIFKTLLPASDAVILTAADTPRAADPEILKQYVKERPAEAIRDAKRALEYAYSVAGRDDLILVTGSLFLVGEARKWHRELKTQNFSPCPSRADKAEKLKTV